MVEDPDELQAALAALSALESSARVQATREMKERIVKRWPDSPEAKRIAAELARRRERARSNLVALRHDQAVARAKRETEEKQSRLDRVHRESRSSARRAEGEAARITDVDHAPSSKRCTHPLLSSAEALKRTPTGCAHRGAIPPLQS
jgi:hypothetical protein